MKKQTKLNRKQFRYLSKKEFKDPLYGIAAFCRTVTSLGDYQDDIQNMIRISSTSPKGTKPREYSDLLFDWKCLVKQIELLYVLAHRESDWSIRPDSKYYELNIQYGRGTVYDETLYRGSYLYFEHLKAAEMRNIGIFIRKFFKFKSLRKWYKLMDILFETLFEEDSLACFCDYADDQAKLFNYLEKLAEAFYFIYVTKAKEHIFNHYVDEFHLEKYLQQADAVETEQGASDGDEPIESLDAESSEETAEEDV